MSEHQRDDGSGMSRAGRSGRGVVASLVVCFFLLVSPFVRADWPNACEQAVVVIAEGWNSTTGEIVWLERVDEVWKVAGKARPVTLGRAGLGVGRGLHPRGLQGPEKREGDKRAPAGVFVLEGGFGKKALSLRSFPYHQSRVGDFWVDDPTSDRYNEWVHASQPSEVRSNSAETLLRRDGIYDYAVIVGHNRNPIQKGAGSAIFMHVWVNPGVPTIGCTAMDKGVIRELLNWLAADKMPVLVQVPRANLGQLRLPSPLESAIRQIFP